MAAIDDSMENRSHPIKEDMQFQIRLWRVERLGWILLGFLVLATLLGLFSTGPLSISLAATPSRDLQVEYQRFERNAAASNMKVRAKADAAGEVWLNIEGQFLGTFTIETIQPQPTKSHSTGAGLNLQFKADDSGWIEAYFTIRPDTVGPSTTSVKSAGQRVSFWQLIYP